MEVTTEQAMKPGARLLWSVGKAMVPADVAMLSIREGDEMKLMRKSKMAQSRGSEVTVLQQRSWYLIFVVLLGRSRD